MPQVAFSLSEDDFRTLVSRKILTLTAQENGETVLTTSIILGDIGFGRMADIIREVCDEKFGN